MDAKFEPKRARRRSPVAAVRPVALGGSAQRPAFLSRLALASRLKGFYYPAEGERYVTQAAVERGRLNCLFPKF